MEADPVAALFWGVREVLRLGDWRFGTSIKDGQAPT
jgi:hypothetical protein